MMEKFEHLRLGDIIYVYSKIQNSESYSEEQITGIFNSSEFGKISIETDVNKRLIVVDRSEGIFLSSKIWVTVDRNLWLEKISHIVKRQISILEKEIKSIETRRDRLKKDYLPYIKENET